MTIQTSETIIHILFCTRLLCYKFVISIVQKFLSLSNKIIRLLIKYLLSSLKYFSKLLATGLLYCCSWVWKGCSKTVVGIHYRACRLLSLRDEYLSSLVYKKRMINTSEWNIIFCTSIVVANLDVKLIYE